MNSTKRALVVVMLTSVLGMWGCTQNGASPSASSRLRELEAKTARLEDDFKSVSAARDQARTKLANAEEQRLLLTAQLEALTRERDEFKAQSKNRTAERDNLQSQLAQFGRDLKSLLTKVDEAALSTGGQAPAISAPTVEVAPTLPSKQ
jgi:chromosome segregation ATPase